MAMEVVLADKPVAWHLETPLLMHEATQELLVRGYRYGMDGQRQPGSEVPEQVVEFNPEDGRHQPVKAGLGDYLILSGNVLQRLSAEEYAAVTA